MPTVVFDGQDSNLIRANTEVNGEGKFREEVQSHVAFHDPPLTRRVLNLSNRTLKGIQKLPAEIAEAFFIESHRVDQFGFGIGMVVNSIKWRAARPS